MPPTAEVLVVSYASAQVIERLLASLAAVIPDVPVAIREHAADRAAVDALEHLASVHPAPVRIEHDPTNPGFAAGCNALAAGSTADFLAFCNPDTEMVTWPWNGAEAPPRATIVGPVMSQDPHAHYGRTFRIRDEIALSWLRRRPERPDGAGYVSGAGLLVERAAFERIGGFDPGYFMFYEDIDLCLRANAAGIATVVDPQWTMHHARHHSTAARFGASLLVSYESALRFYDKRGSPVWAYRGYKLVDAALRCALHAVRRERPQAAGYAAVVRRVIAG